MSERLWDSGVLRAYVVLVLLAGAAVATVAATGVDWPAAAVNLVLAAPSVLLAAAMCRTAARHPGVTDPAARRFWRTSMAAMLVIGAALGVQDVGFVLHANTLAAAGVGVQIAGEVMFAWPQLRLATGATSRPDRVALWLDIAILVSVAAIFLSHLIAEHVVVEPGPGVLSQLAPGCVGLFLLVRLLMGGSRTLPPRSLAFMALGAFTGSTLLPVASLLFGWRLGTADMPPWLPADLIPIGAGLFLVLAARCQIVDRALTGRPTMTSRPRGWMPYLAVLLVDALLLQHVVAHDADLLIVAVGAVLLTVLVVIRQIVAYEQNTILLRRLGRFRLLVQNSSDVVAINKPDGTFTYCSPAVTRVLGHSPDEIVGTSLLAWAHPDDIEEVRVAWRGVVAAPGGTATYRARIRTADGGWLWLEIIAQNLTDDPSIRGILTNTRDVTETRQVEDRLSHEATHDALTGLANRVLFGRRVTAATAGTTPFSLVLIDLDDFKTVNDTLGHAVGDRLLIAVAERMTVSVRPTDTVARLGGDEFAILLDGLTGDAVDRVLGRIAEALLVPVAADDELISVRASFGVADGRPGDDADELLRRADIAMYEAKARNEGGHQRYREGMEARGALRNRLTAALRTALDEDQFVVYYQPVVALPDGRITGAEALVRWQHPVRGLLGPVEFVAVAEESGLIVPLGRWVLRTAARQAAAWPAWFSVSVNVSVHQLRSPAFADEVADELAGAGLPAHRLCLEITESTAVGGGATLATLRRLRDLGVRLSLDDFGTGASTLSVLATCPVDQIKLDRSFVSGPDAIPQAVLHLARALGVEAVAEGIETEEQASHLAAMGYERAQGYLFARPMPSSDLTARLAGAVS